MAITELKPYLSNIADKLKSLLGITDKINAQDFVEKIDEVYEQGKKSQYDEFWDGLQCSGDRRDYIGTFSGRGWNEENFKPKYDIKPIRANSMFANDCEWGSSDYNGIKDLPACLERAGVELDFSRCTNFSGVWVFSCIEHIGIVDTRAANNLNQTFYYAMRLHTIDEIILKDDGSQTFPNATFYKCDNFENVKFTGCIGQNVSFSDSPLLTYESLMGEKGIINVLKDYSGTTTTKTLTLHADAKARLSESDIAIATQKGWTIS
jgi:hypothetical protein